MTHFLASHNIDANQIQLDYARRREEAERQQQEEAGEDGRDDENEDEDMAKASNDENEDPAERKKRKRKEEMALMKIKQSKEFKRRKMTNNLDVDDDELARRMMAKTQPLPGQLDNCEQCGKRFTVTPYCRTGPSGGLLCMKCTKALKDDEKKDEAAMKKQKKSIVPRARRRQNESDRMMGDVKPGAKSLVDMCVRKVADVVNEVDDFGDVPQGLLDRFSQILSKRRAVTSRVLELFLRPDVNRIVVYDGGKLETEDFNKIFAFMPQVELVNLRFAGQLKDESALYMAEKCKKIRHLQLGATNLVSDDAWIKVFRSLGPQLETLKLSELNDALGDSTVEDMTKQCQNLKRLKLRSCTLMTPTSLEHLQRLTKLEHLTLNVVHNNPAKTLAELVSSVGSNLRTLCLEEFSELDDTVLEAIKDHCPNLLKVRVTGSSICTDRAFASLFDNNSPFPPLEYADFSDNRDIDNENPDGPEADPVGFGSRALVNLMNHSAAELRCLNIKSCRHISAQALENVFDGKKKYPNLKEIDLSFVRQVNELVMAGIFQSCPALEKLVVFACFNARGTGISKGIAVIGLPNAMDNIIQGEDLVMQL